MAVSRMYYLALCHLSTALKEVIGLHVDDHKLQVAVFYVDSVPETLVLQFQKRGAPLLSMNLPMYQGSVTFVGRSSPLTLAQEELMERALYWFMEASEIAELLAPSMNGVTLNNRLLDSVTEARAVHGEPK